MALDRLISLAQYELEQDPYRGMLSPPATNQNTPWNQCQFVREIEDESSSSTQKVFDTCHVTCPSLVHWTELHEKEMGKRRKRKRAPAVRTKDVLGHRPTESDFQCACDYNPLCLGSLGGVMDQLLEKVAKQLREDEEMASIESNSQVSQQNEVIALDGVDSLASSSVAEREQKRTKPSPPLEFAYSSDDASNVEPGKHRPSGVYQKEIHTEVMELDPENDNAVYSIVTAEEMKEVRKTCEIDVAPVRSYVEGTILSQLGSNGVSLSFENYMEELRKWHDSLSFSNPLLTGPMNGSDKLVIAIPPGIKNLGATCYLNTQFQCLARMTAFLNGIFSWTPPEENHQMNSVLSSMQLLFARMAHGAEVTLTTQEFSDALGLENDEMQDPNEFARLLFERMHESFQKCSGQGEKEDLSQLLPKLFHGVTTYETVCLTCQNQTERSEGFMDLNLPIVHPDGKDSKKSGQLKITDTFVGTADTNLQYCLNQYVAPEELSGENQYSCECCQTKRDALRTTSFQDLPPLLNVQLSRYVFDRLKFVKKKLTDKVLLPRTLTVPRKGEDVDSTYLLCAVMKHRGSSAYHGHYIAEAMDWQSGTWFEFNDEIVSVLDGPSCSYAPEELDTLDKKKVKGSQDAYNMYYVEEGFLAKCASNFLTTRAETEQTSVLAKVGSEREHRYSMLTEMCLNDGRVACRLMQRRVGLMSKLSTELASPTGSVLFNRKPLMPDNGACPAESLPVWVDGPILRRFLSCDKADLSSIISASGPLLKHKQLLCEHGTGLHPRVARRGKLLPRPMYDAVVSLMLGERRMLNGEDESVGIDALSQFDEAIVNDCIITPDHNMYCEACAEAYKVELQQKIDGLCRLRQLFYDLDQKTNKIEIADGGDDSSSDSDPNGTVFLVSKKFITKFRARVNQIIKTAEKSELQSQGGNDEAYCAGLDAVDLSAFGSNSSSDGLDPFVNSMITCEHGKCNAVDHRRVKRVTSEVWRQLNLWFPEAIRHEVGKDITNKELGCYLCEEEETSEGLLADKLKAWGKGVTSSSVLQDLAKRKRTVAEVEMELIMSTDTESEPFGEDPANDVILVHRKDVDSWRAALKQVKKHSGKATSALTEFLIEKVFSSQTGKSMDRTDIASYMGHSMVSLCCGDHFLSREKVVLKDDLDPTKSCLALLHSSIEAFTPSQYAAFIGSIYGLGLILCSEVPGKEDETESTEEHPRGLLRSMEKHHPRLRCPLNQLDEQQIYVTGVPLDRALFLQHFSGGFCLDKDCDKKFDKLYDLRSQYLEEKDQPKAIHIDLVNGTVGEACLNSEGATFSLRAFQIDAGTKLDVAVSSILGLPRSENNAAPDRAYGSLRRSSRKRKTTYPSGPILREDSLEILAHYNIAAVRLFLYEKYPGFRVDQELTLIVPKSRDTVGAASNDGGNHVDMTLEEETAMDASGTPPYVALKIPYESNEKSFEEVVKSAVEGKDIVPESLLKTHLRSEVFLSWREQRAEKKKSAKKSEQDAPVPVETLMEGLLEMSNVSSGGDETPAGSKKRSTRRAERGFRGTLLHSSSAPNSDETKKSVDSGPPDGSSAEEKKENQVSNVIVPSDKASSKTDDATNRPSNNVVTEGGSDDIVAVQESAPASSSGPAVVVLDDSDDEKPSRQTRQNRSDEDISVLVSHTMNATTTASSPGRHLRSSFLNPKEEVIFNKLVSCLSDEQQPSTMSSIHTRCRDAARWAIASNGSNATIDSLADSALAKYWEESS